MLSREYKELLAIENDGSDKMLLEDFLNEFVVPEDLLQVIR